MYISMPLMRQSRHPLIRALSLVLAIAVIGVLLVFGLAIAGVLLVGGAVLLAVRHWKQGHRPANPAATHRDSHQPAVLEGEFTVVDQQHSATH